GALGVLAVSSSSQQARGVCLPLTVCEFFRRKRNHRERGSEGGFWVRTKNRKLKKIPSRPPYLPVNPLFFQSWPRSRATRWRGWSPPTVCEFIRARRGTRPG